ncbi:hypothetical protein [Pseudomonas sp. MAG733B]|uniref:hypothetical protein n=1 Tax=Pseudomonas sp. MAG733B TaxID=3122079 RepID=UPI0030D1E6BE
MRDELVKPRKWQSLIILTVMIFGLSYGLSAPLIAIKLTAAGFSELYVGINAAMQAVGSLPLHLYCHAMPAFQSKNAVGSVAGATVFLLALFPFTPIEGWFSLRLCLGVSIPGRVTLVARLLMWVSAYYVTGIISLDFDDPLPSPHFMVPVGRSGRGLSLLQAFADWYR